MRKESAVITLLTAQQREWRARFPGLANRVHQSIVGYLCSRGRSGAPMRQLYGVTKTLFLLDDATVRERVETILELGLCESDPPNERLSGRSVVIPTETLLREFDAYLRPLVAHVRAIDQVRAPPVPAELSDRDREAMLFAFDAYSNAWLSAAERFLASRGLSPARRAEARRRLTNTSYWVVMHLAIEHADMVRSGKGAEDSLLADQLAANVLEQTAQGFQSIRDHIRWLLGHGMLDRHPGRGLRVSLANEVAPYFDDALAQAAAELTEVARRLGSSTWAACEVEDVAERTIRLTMPDEIVSAPAEPRYFLEIVAPPEAADRIPLSDTPLVIGRAPPADKLLPGRAVSRTHCRVELADGQVRITDLRSTNGTFVDGERIQDERMLEQGSTVGIGPYTLILGHDTLG